MRTIYLLMCFAPLGLTVVCAQPIRYEAEVGGMTASVRQTPFWLRANQYGTVPLNSPAATVRLGMYRDYKTRPDSAKSRRTSRFGWGFGINAVANAALSERGLASASEKWAAFFPDAYAKIRYGRLELFAGNRREVYGIGDTLLTSGFVAWSGNALPFPKIQLHTPDYVSLGFTKHLFAFRAGYAHGWFINTYIRGSYLHQKYLYARLGKPHWRVRFYGGLNHQVQWGGRADYLVGTALSVDGSLPTSFRDYLSIVTGSYPDAIQSSRFTDFDGTNRIGNHVGSYDVGVEWNGPKANWLLYRQHPYEDASGLSFQNLPDGLTGLRFLNHQPATHTFQIRRVVVEWLRTTNQSGPTFDLSARFQGQDNYFNNSQYREGWSYRVRTIGTPFIMPGTDLAPAVAGLSSAGFFPNNRLITWYAGLNGAFRNGPTLTVRASHSRNFGMYKRPYPAVFRQFSGLLSAQWPLGRRAGTLLSTSFALDRGELLPDSFGGFLSVRRTW
ncbi:capsule assembly Wzi family protein [Spirosoma montaniterrae]|uniref:Capsule assembly Wzi family protein n=1 Tax=Spirosoma montaniterrae TaxID=1178516 RepID=A0A1P9X4Y6_9BACT|nr:capsule assembly Wzi family protein [Spirosoma montaniterrae]AQG82681.1 hypothetical protein AWR27_24285 [Spirosoma montaniterrae]